MLDRRCLQLGVVAQDKTARKNFGFGPPLGWIGFSR
jgi:hypothetical protein